MYINKTSLLYTYIHLSGGCASILSQKSIELVQEVTGSLDSPKSLALLRKNSFVQDSSGSFQAGVREFDSPTLPHSSFFLLLYLLQSPHAWESLA